MGNGRDFVSLSFRLTGLAPNTLYHYRVVASNSKGIAYGENETFLTGIQPPTPMKKIAFFNYPSYPADAVGLNVMNEDGSGVKRIAPSTRSGTQIPIWSPDGKKIAYIDSDNFGGPGGLYEDLWVVNEDGTGWKNLTNTPEINEGDSFYCLNWSPDSNKILFCRWGIYEVDASGSNQRCLTCDMEYKFFVDFPSYSHDGSKIAFVMDGDLWVMDADGSNPKEVYPSSCQKTNRFVDCVHKPQFTLDDSHIIFSIRDIIYLISAEGGEPLRLTPLDFKGNDLVFPFLSPDGQKIAFAPFCLFPNSIYVVNVDGSQFRKIADTGNIPMSWLSWSPDSQRIVYEDDGSIAVVGIDGNSPPRFLKLAGYSPSWQP